MHIFMYYYKLILETRCFRIDAGRFRVSFQWPRPNMFTLSMDFLAKQALKCEIVVNWYNTSLGSYL